MIQGKYSSPKVESRIFMFIDMKNSTVLAEKLGHKKYSLLLRNCYSDLNKTAYKFGARIYQYVGDEVVIPWKISTGLKSLNCIRAFNHFKNRISKRRSFYETNFNLVPVFKAGMDTGVVTVAEIGEIKREIAYHGTVLNPGFAIENFRVIN
jgi:adenylate cyclase